MGVSISGVPRTRAGIGVYGGPSRGWYCIGGFAVEGGRKGIWLWLIFPTWGEHSAEGFETRGFSLQGRIRPALHSWSKKLAGHGRHVRGMTCKASRHVSHAYLSSRVCYSAYGKQALKFLKHMLNICKPHGKQALKFLKHMLMMHHLPSEPDACSIHGWVSTGGGDCCL